MNRSPLTPEIRAQYALAAWRHASPQARAERVRRMHAGRDRANTERQKNESLYGKASLSFTEFRRAAKARAHDSIYRFRRIARILTLLRVANPIPEGRNAAGIEEVDTLFASKRCAVMEAPLAPTMWTENHASLRLFPVPMPIDPALGMSSGNLLAVSHSGFRTLVGRAPDGVYKLALRRFTRDHPEIIVSKDRILPNLRQTLSLDDLPPDIREELDYLESDARARAEAEITEYLAKAEDAQEAREFPARPEEVQEPVGIVAVWKPEAL